MVTWKLHFNLGPWFSLLNLYKNLLFTTFKLNLEVLNWLVLLVDLMKFVWLTWGMGLKKMVTNRSFSIAGLKIEFKAGIRSLNSDDLTTPFYVLFFYQPLSFMMLMDSTWKHIKLPFLYNRWLDSHRQSKEKDFKLCMLCLFYSSLKNFAARVKIKEST